MSDVEKRYEDIIYELIFPSFHHILLIFQTND